MREILKSFVPGFDRQLRGLRTTCENRLCSSTQLIRSVPGSKLGISVGQTWFCCVDCFVAGSCIALERLSNLTVLERERQPRLSLGLFLLSKGFLTAEKLRIATEESRQQNEDIKEVLIRLGFVTERHLAAARSAQWGYPLLAPGFVWQSVEVDVPRSLLRVCRAVPLHHSVAAKRILVGFSETVEHRFIELIERVTHCRIEPCVITPIEFEEQLERLIVPADYEEVLVDDVHSAERMARAAGRNAVEIKATEAVFGKWRNFVLVRLEGKRSKTDVVFQLSCNSVAEIEEQSGDFNQAIAV